MKINDQSYSIAVHFGAGFEIPKNFFLGVSETVSNAVKHLDSGFESMIESKIDGFKTIRQHMKHDNNGLPILEMGLLAYYSPDVNIVLSIDDRSRSIKVVGTNNVE